MAGGQNRTKGNADPTRSSAARRAREAGRHRFTGTIQPADTAPNPLNALASKRRESIDRDAQGRFNTKVQRAPRGR